MWIWRTSDRRFQTSEMRWSVQRGAARSLLAKSDQNPAWSTVYGVSGELQTRKGRVVSDWRIMVRVDTDLLRSVSIRLQSFVIVL